MKRTDHRSKVAATPFAARKGIAPLRGLSLFVSGAILIAALTACSLADPPKRGRGPSPPPDQAAIAPPQPTAMDTFRALAPPEGMKFTPLFAEQVGDEERFRRLEGVVQQMKNDFDTVMPSIVRLVAIEKDIKDLVGQLETLTGDAVASEPVEPVEALPVPDVLPNPVTQIPREDSAGGTETETASTPAVAEPQADTSRVTPEAAPEGELPPEGAASPSSPLPPVNLAPQASPEAAAVPQPQLSPAPAPAVPAAVVPGPALGDVKAVRIGDHMDKTRIVLDMTAKTDVTSALENNGKRLVVTLPRMTFSPAPAWEAMSAALVSGYHFENGKLYLDLLYPSIIKSQMVLAPNGSPGYRLVIDVYSKDVHQ